MTACHNPGNSAGQVSDGIVQVLRALIESYASEVGAREVSSVVSDLLPILIDKTGDNNSRIRYAASHESLRLRPV